MKRKLQIGVMGSAADLKYHSDLAKKISEITGPKLILHEISSVGTVQVRNLFSDGVAKVNIWTDNA